MADREVEREHAATIRRFWLAPSWPAALVVRVQGRQRPSGELVQRLLVGAGGRAHGGHLRRRPFHRRHKPPGTRCGCGLYALSPQSRRSASEVFRAEGPHGLPREIPGLVEAWGQVELHETGFRAQFARPIALILHRDQAGTEWAELMEKLARAHRAVVLFVRTPEELARYCRQHDLGLSPGTVGRLLPKEHTERQVPRRAVEPQAWANAWRSRGWSDRRAWRPDRI